MYDLATLANWTKRRIIGETWPIGTSLSRSGPSNRGFQSAPALADVTVEEV
jgi:hypothetical protein